MTLDLNELARRALANLSQPAQSPVYTPPPVGNQAQVTEDLRLQAMSEHRYDDGAGGIWTHPGTADTCPRPECQRHSDCDRCNYDRHQCPGCGVPLSHFVGACSECMAEHGPWAATMPVKVDPWTGDPDPGLGDPWAVTVATQPEGTVTTSPEPGNTSIHPESCIHCEADITYVPETQRWVSVRGGFRVSSCKVSPTLMHQAPEEPANPGGDHKTPHSTQIWQSVAGAEPKVTGQVELEGKADAEGELRHVNFMRSVAELRAEMGEPAPMVHNVLELDRKYGKPAPDTDAQLRLEAIGGTVPNWPAQPMEAEDPEELAAEMAPNTQEIGDLADRWQRREELRAAQAEHDAESRRLKAEREEVERELFDAVPTGYVATIEGRPVFEVVESETTRVDIKKWQAKNPNWKTGRYASTTVTTRIKLIGE